MENLKCVCILNVYAYALELVEKAGLFSCTQRFVYRNSDTDSTKEYDLQSVNIMQPYVLLSYPNVMSSITIREQVRGLAVY